ncbi:MAG TPA: hypothetical protein VH740_04120 [Vicinamibacterales bacterium]|jgi:hypothetical protein
MKRLERRERFAVAFWVMAAIVVWNGLYDLLLDRNTQTYLFEAAIHQAGLGPPVDLTAAMDYSVAQAVWLSTLWACALLVAALATIRFFRLKADAAIERSIE